MRAAFFAALLGAASLVSANDFEKRASCAKTSTVTSYTSTKVVTTTVKSSTVTPTSTVTKKTTLCPTPTAKLMKRTTSTKCPATKTTHKVKTTTSTVTKGVKTASTTKLITVTSTVSKCSSSSSSTTTKVTNPTGTPNVIVHIDSAQDYCIIVPNKAHTDIGDSEQPGGMRSYCTNPGSGQGQIPSGFSKSLSTQTGSGYGAYTQLTGCINPGSLDRLNAKDDGGQYDSNGGDGGHGNPENSRCTGFSSYVELIEPSSNRLCIRCCQDNRDCPTTMDQSGCQTVIPNGKYSGCDS